MNNFLCKVALFSSFMLVDALLIANPSSSSSASQETADLQEDKRQQELINEQKRQQQRIQDQLIEKKRQDNQFWQKKLDDKRWDEKHRC